MSAAAVGMPAGNAYDKDASRNPVARRLVSRFRADLDELWQRAAPASVLDVGCGDGALAWRWANRLGDRRVVAVDRDDPGLRAAWAARRRANLAFRAGDASRLEFGADEFDMAAAVEVLEHVADPDAALAELCRVARRWLLVSVPREPLWRALNVARGAYLAEFGDTPGHLHHWSRRAFTALVSRYGAVAAARSPLPWTMLLVRVG
jgi:2-polyprenyl-3-methyl-5-hydroxy-6-metoxy-1,4-benzoquinol methylase